MKKHGEKWYLTLDQSIGSQFYASITSRMINLNKGACINKEKTEATLQKYQRYIEDIINTGDTIDVGSN